MSNATFKRGQLEFALWRVVSGRATRAPSIFLTRLKRLLEADRKYRPIKRSGVEVAKFAFADHQTEGKGNEATFSKFDAFCLGLAFDMLDAGYNPKDIIILIRYIRKDLQRQFASCLRNPIVPRQDIDPIDRPDCPTVRRGLTDFADCRRFIVLQRTELVEAMNDARGGSVTDPFFLHPVYCRGVTELAKELDSAGDLFRKVYVQELAHLACGLSVALDEAPEIKRGRK